jgi:hypothetical protein
MNEIEPLIPETPPRTSARRRRPSALRSYTSAFELFVAINVFGLVATFVSTRCQEERSRMAVRAAGSAKAELKAKA